MSAPAAATNALANADYAVFSPEPFQKFRRWMANDNSKVDVKTKMGSSSYG
jgi:hypothetical protein